MRGGRLGIASRLGNCPASEALRTSSEEISFVLSALFGAKLETSRSPALSKMLLGVLAAPLRHGCIASVAMLPSSLPDEDKIARAHILFSKREGRFDRFEIWDGGRAAFSYPDPAPEAWLA